jgi:penicillin-binding protein 1A
MPETPTPIIHPAARAERFQRTNGVPQTNGSGPPPQKPKLKKLRVALVAGGISILALISTIFGMLMAVASDLPSLENRAQYKSAKNSVLYADNWGCKNPGHDDPKCLEIAKLTGNQNRILVGEGEVSPNVKNAVIAIEDRRFYSHKGVDYTGIARAFGQDILKRRAAQGGSTITQQFVKNALAAQGDRSVFQKLREAALAYHLERKWSKEKILTQYLNTVYFGNGAYGIESAVRTYFGSGDPVSEREGAADTGVSYTPPVTADDGQVDPNAREAMDVAPHEAALLAGMISSPSMYDPVQHPQAATARRNQVLQRMLEMHTITQAQYDTAIRQSLPSEDDINPPKTESQQPYFTSWMTEHLLDRYRAGKVFAGGLKVRTTLDPDLQDAAERAIVGRLSGVGPDAALVAIQNDTGEVRAMVGGSDFNARPFNLATNGHRQPGSAIKPFILARALDDGISPDSVWASQPLSLPFVNGHGQKGRFEVSNYDDAYYGSSSLWSATTHSDNSVFAQLGMKVGRARVARLAQRMGIRTKLSRNPAMLLGGLKEGVTPLEMAYAYSTIANDGLKISGSMAPQESGPVAIQSVEDDGDVKQNERRETRVLPAKVAQVEKDMLHLVVTGGTGKAAQVGDEYIWGKTGTTENYGDAWFVGGNNDMTVAIWVGYADKLQPMQYEHGGAPVAGGTFPAEIFHDFMTSWLTIRQERRLERAANKDEEGTATDVAPATPVSPTEVPETPAAPTDAGTGGTTGDGGTGGTGGGGGGGGGGQQPAPPQNQQPAQPAPTPAQPETPPPTGGGGGGVSPGGTP